MKYIFSTHAAAWNWKVSEHSFRAMYLVPYLLTRENSLSRSSDYFVMNLLLPYRLGSNHITINPLFHEGGMKVEYQTYPTMR